MIGRAAGVGFGVGPWLSGSLSHRAGGDAQGLRLAPTARAGL